MGRVAQMERDPGARCRKRVRDNPCQCHLVLHPETAGSNNGHFCRLAIAAIRDRSSLKLRSNRGGVRRRGLHHRSPTSPNERGYGLISSVNQLGPSKRHGSEVTGDPAARTQRGFRKQAEQAAKRGTSAAVLRQMFMLLGACCSPAMAARKLLSGLGISFTPRNSCLIRTGKGS